MPKIAHTLNEFYEYLSKLEINLKKPPVVCLNFKVEAQHGQTCKLMAGFNVENYLFSQQRNSMQPLPVNKNKKYPYSLRKRAKELLHSEVGEVYGPKQYKAVLTHNQFTVNSFKLRDAELARNFIKDQLNHGFPVITFFNVIIPHDLTGIPGNPAKGSNFEHGAVIIGYYFDADDKLQLLIAQWNNAVGSYFEFPFETLHESTMSLDETKKIEHYKKFNPVPGFFDRPMWLEVNQLKGMLDRNYQHTGDFSWFVLSNIAVPIWPFLAEKSTNPPLGNEGSLRAVFTVISGDQQDISHFNQYQKYLIDTSSVDNKPKM